MPFQAQQTRDPEQYTLHNYSTGWSQSCYLNLNFSNTKGLSGFYASLSDQDCDVFFYESLAAQAATAQCHFLKSCMLALQKAAIASLADRVVSGPTWSLWSPPTMKQYFQTVDDTVGN